MYHIVQNGKTVYSSQRYMRALKLANVWVRQQGGVFEVWKINTLLVRFERYRGRNVSMEFVRQICEM